MTPERFARLRRVLARRQPDLTVVMERVNKPHNFSAILRNADAVGVLEAHIVPPEQGVELHHHTSAGSSKWVDVHEHASISDAVGRLRDHGYHVVAAHPETDATHFREVDYTRPTAFMMGAELFGISDEGLALADSRVVIPMVGMVRSLNVSVATALLLFEAQRQRTDAGMYRSARIPEPEFGRRLFEWAYPELAERCRAAEVPYPALDEDGSLLERPQL